MKYFKNLIIIVFIAFLTFGGLIFSGCENIQGFFWQETYKSVEAIENDGEIMSFVSSTADNISYNNSINNAINSSDSQLLVHYGSLKTAYQTTLRAAFVPLFTLYKTTFVHEPTIIRQNDAHIKFKELNSQLNSFKNQLNSFKSAKDIFVNYIADSSDLEGINQLYKLNEFKQEYNSLINKALSVNKAFADLYNTCYAPISSNADAVSKASKNEFYINLRVNAQNMLLNDCVTLYFNEFNGIFNDSTNKTLNLELFNSLNVTNNKIIKYELNFETINKENLKIKYSNFLSYRNDFLNERNLVYNFIGTEQIVKDIDFENIEDIANKTLIQNGYDRLNQYITSYFNQYELRINDIMGLF